MAGSVEVPSRIYRKSYPMRKDVATADSSDGEPNEGALLKTQASLGLGSLKPLFSTSEKIF